MYNFILKNPTTEEIWNIPFYGINLTEELNAGINGQININYPSLNKYAKALNTTPDTIIMGGNREWYLRKNNTNLFGGVLLNLNESGSGKEATSYSLTFCDFLNSLERRHAEEGEDWSFTDIDFTNIAKAIVELTNAKSNTGITFGTTPLTGNTAVRNFKFDNIRDELIKMSNKNLDDTYDIEVTFQKVMNFFYPQKGNIITDFRFQSNIVSWSKNQSLAGNLANSVTVLGKDNEDGTTLLSTVEDLTSQETWGLQQEILSAKDISTESTLTKKGNRILAQKGSPKPKVSIRVDDKNPPIEQYSVGDSVRTIIKKINLDEYLRILKRTIQIMPSGHGIIDLTFDYGE